MIPKNAEWKMQNDVAMERRHMSDDRTNISDESKAATRTK